MLRVLGLAACVIAGLVVGSAGEPAVTISVTFGVAFSILALVYWSHELEGRIKSLEYNLRVAMDMAKDRDE